MCACVVCECVQHAYVLTHACMYVGQRLMSGYHLLSFSTFVFLWQAFFFFLFLFCFVFRDRVSLYGPGWPGTHFVYQVGLELRNPPASASQVLGLKTCLTTAQLFFFLKIYLFIVCEYTVAVFRHTRRGHRIPLQMVVSHHVVAGNWIQDFWKNSQCS